MTIIGLVGKAGSGKSTAAKHLETLGFNRGSIATPIKEMAIKYFGCTHEEVYNTKPPHVRQILQGIGMFGRYVHMDFWLVYIFHQIKNISCIVIDDLRLVDETKSLQNKFGAIIVKLKCPDSPEALALTDEQRAHPTEAEVDLIDADYIISLPYGNVDRLKKDIEAIAFRHIPMPMGGRGNESI